MKLTIENLKKKVWLVRTCRVLVVLTVVAWVPLFFIVAIIGLSILFVLEVFVICPYQYIRTGKSEGFFLTKH